MVFLEAKSGRRHNNVSDNQIKPTGKEFWEFWFNLKKIFLRCHTTLLCKSTTYFKEKIIDTVLTSLLWQSTRFTPSIVQNTQLFWVSKCFSVWIGWNVAWFATIDTCWTLILTVCQICMKKKLAQLWNNKTIHIIWLKGRLFILRTECHSHSWLFERIIALLIYSQASLQFILQIYESCEDNVDEEKKL